MPFKKKLKAIKRLVQQSKVSVQLTWIKRHVSVSVSQTLLDKEIFEERLRTNLENKNREFVKLYDSVKHLISMKSLNEYYEYGQQIKKYVADTSVILNDALDEGQSCPL